MRLSSSASLASLYLGDKDNTELALERLDEEMALQTLPDGMHWEQSSMYQAEVLHAALDTLLVAERTETPVPERLKDSTHLLAKGLARSLRPDGRCYLFGDSDEIDMRDLAASAAVLFGDSELSYYAAGGLDEEFMLSHSPETELPEPEKPESLSFHMKESGNVFIRMSDERALRFHAGPIGSGHGHLDQLSFDIYDSGNVIITDTGRYTYQDTEERRFLKGTYGHNTVILDGMEQSAMSGSWDITEAAAAAINSVVIRENCSFISASHSGYAGKGASVTRHILTLGNSFVIIADDIRTVSGSNAEILLHFDTGTTLSEKDGVFTARKERSRVKLIFPHGGKPEVSESLISKHYNELDSSPLITLRERVDGRKCIVTVIAFDEFSCTPLPVIKTQSGNELPDAISFGARLEAEGKRYDAAIVTNEYPHGGFLTGCGDAAAYGRVLVSVNGGETEVLAY